MGEIKKQSVNSTLLSYCGALIGFLSLIYIQPYFLGSKNIGLLKLVYNFSWIVAMIMPLGVGNVTMRFFPKFNNESNKHNGYFALLFLIVSAGAGVLLILFLCAKPAFESFYSKNPELLPYYFYCYLLAYVLALITVYNIYCAYLLKTTFTVFLTDVYSRIAFILIILMYYFGWVGEKGLVISYLSTFVLQLFLLFIYLYKQGVVTLKINWAFFKSLDKKPIYIFAVIMLLSAFASLGIKIIDSLMLGHYIGNLHLIGVYGVCAFIPTILEIPYNSMERIVLPKVSTAWHLNDTKEVAKIYEMSSRYLFFIGSMIFCFLYASTDLIFTFLPDEYIAGKYVFFVLALSSLLNLATGVNSAIIIVSNKYFVTSFLLFILIVVGVALNILFIPEFGITGAAMATFIALSLFNVLKYIYILIRFKMQPFSVHTAYISAVTILSLVIIYFLPHNMHVFFRAVLGCAIAAILFGVYNIKFNTIEEVNKVFRRFKLIK